MMVGSTRKAKTKPAGPSGRVRASPKTKEEPVIAQLRTLLDEQFGGFQQLSTGGHPEQEHAQRALQAQAARDGAHEITAAIFGQGVTGGQHGDDTKQALEVW